MADDIKKELTEEEKAKVKEQVEDQLNKFGEVYSQCWESDEFKTAFIENPKAIFEEYGINYNKDIEYRIIDTPEKTVISVLPYKKIRQAIKDFEDKLLKQVEDIDDEEGKQIILEGWKYEIYQNTENTIYIPIPLCPESLTAEELEMINGGCLVAALVMVFVTMITAEATMTATSAVFIAEIAVTFVGAVDVLALVEFVEAAAVFETAIYAHVYTETTGTHVLGMNDKQQIFVAGE